MMNLFDSPSAVVLFLAIITVVISQIAGDIMDTKKQLKAKLLSAKSKSAPRTKISVIINANNPSVFETLNSLEANMYKHIEVIVFCTSRSKSLVKSLRSYQRKAAFNKLRIITAREKLSQAQFADKYASGSLVMAVSAGTLIEKDYFKKNIVHFKDKKLQVLVGIRTVKLHNSMNQAIGGSRQMFRNYFKRVYSPSIILSNKLQDNVIYRKSTIINIDNKGQKLVSLMICRSIVCTNKLEKTVRSTNKLSRILARYLPTFSGYIPLFGLIIITSVIASSEGVKQAIFVLYIFSFLTIMTGIFTWSSDKFRNLSAKLSLVLLLPFALVTPKGQ